MNQKPREISEAEREMMRLYAQVLIEREERKRLHKLLWPRRYR